MVSMFKCEISILVILIIICCINSMTANVVEKQLPDTEIYSYTSENSSSEINKTTLNENVSLQEGRGWKKTALPFLLGITLKMTTLLPMISSLMTVLGGVALVASKLALVISVALAVHYYLMTKQQMQFHRQPFSHSQIYDNVLPVTPYPVSHRLSVQAS